MSKYRVVVTRVEEMDQETLLKRQEKYRYSPYDQQMAGMASDAQLARVLEIELDQQEYDALRKAVLSVAP